MKRFFQIFYWGMLISFLGSLPPGTMNIAATQITAHQSQRAGVIYAIGSMLTEVIIVRLALAGMKKFIRQYRIFYFLELLTAALLLAMAIACFIAAVQMNDFTNLFPGISLNPFWAGVTLSAINPLHIPFWLGWTTILMNKEVLQPQRKQLNWYVSGIAIGTISGFLVFIFIGQYLIVALQSSQLVICLVAGFALVAVSFFHIKRMILSPASVRYTKMIGKIYK